MKICITCKEELELGKFGKLKTSADGYRWECKNCRNTKLRTGKPNLGRFQKGRVPTHGFKKGCKSQKPFEKGHIPWNRGRYTSENRGSGIKRWAREVKERDGYKCKKCGDKENLEAHHIVPWKKNKLLKHDISNGITLCRSCHIRAEPRNTKKKI